MDFLDAKENLHLWDGFLNIYFEAFPAWEREDEASVLKNVKKGIYKLFLLFDGTFDGKDKVLGFVLLDMYGEDYILLSFLAIKKDFRGQGLGTKLCKYAMEFFARSSAKWLLIEAEYRQALLYQKLGFKALDLSYAIPEYNSDKSVAMDLMFLQKDEGLSQEKLRSIVKNMFICGYALDEQDPRLKEQIKRIPSKIKTKEIR